MNNSLFNKYIKNEAAKNFINRMPDYIKEVSNIRKIEKGKIVVLKENTIENIYIHCEGEMRVRNEFENGFIYDFAIINPISYIGAMEVMAAKESYTSTLESNTDCVIMEIPKEGFIQWINMDQQLTLEVLHFICKSMYDQSVKTGEVLAYPAICILINYLIKVFESENQKEVFIEKGREEIASTLGFSVRTINRNLKILKEENLITVSRKGILITDKQCDKLYKKLDSLK